MYYGVMHLRERLRSAAEPAFSRRATAFCVEFESNSARGE